MDVNVKVTGDVDVDVDVEWMAHRMIEFPAKLCAFVPGQSTADHHKASPY